MRASPGDDRSRQSVDVTAEARAYLAQRLGRSSGGLCFRLRIDDDQRMSTVVEDAWPNDRLVRHGDRVVLAIERTLAERLSGSTIDIERTEQGHAALIVL